jgi:hypothetical protein
MQHYKYTITVPPLHAHTAAYVEKELLDQTMAAVMREIDAHGSGHCVKERAFDKCFAAMLRGLTESGKSQPDAIQIPRRIDRSAKFALRDYGLPVVERIARQRQRHQKRINTPATVTARSAFN